MSAICTEQEFSRALVDLRALWDAAPGTPEGDFFEALAARVEAYDREHHPVRPPTAAEAARFRAEQESTL